MSNFFQEEKEWDKDIVGVIDVRIRRKGVAVLLQGGTIAFLFVFFLHRFQKEGEAGVEIIKWKYLTCCNESELVGKASENWAPLLKLLATLYRD